MSKIIKHQKTKFGNLIASLKQSVFLTNVLIVMSGTALAQIIGYAMSPIISRLFSPSDFGVFGSFTAILGIITAGVTLEYSQAIMLPKEESIALDLLIISIFSTVLITVLCILTCLTLPGPVMSLMKAPGSWLLFVLIISILIAGLNISLQSWCVRVKAFKRTSASQVIRSITSNSLQVVLGFLKVGSPGLIVSSTCADLFASFNLASIVIRDVRRLSPKISWNRLKKIAFDFRDFPIYSATANVINAVSTGLPVLLLTKYFGLSAAGYYAFGVKLISAPMSLILRALRQVLFQKACETEHKGESLMTLFTKVTLGLFIISLIPSLILIIWAPQIFSFIFGAQWVTAGKFSRYLVIWQAVMFCNLPSVLFARILRLQNRLFFFDVSLLATRTIALILGGIYMTAETTILIFSIIGAMFNIIFILLIGIALARREGTTTLNEVITYLKRG
jgi:O-antigen/teichoic acid export membrane protein